jgi:hypothetical protein
MKTMLAAILSLAIVPVSLARAEVPADIAVAGEVPIITLSAQGAPPTWQPKPARCTTVNLVIEQVRVM